MSQILDLVAGRRARQLAEEAAANATAGGDPAALDSRLGPGELSEPRVPREPTPDQVADEQFAQTPMHKFMQQRDEPGGEQSPTAWAGRQSGGGQLASGRGSGAAPSQLLQRLAFRNRMEPAAPDPDVVAQGRQKYADEARGWANAASGAYGGNAGDIAYGGPGGSNVLRMAGGFPVIDARGTGGPRQRYGGSMSFDQRAALEQLKNQGRLGVQGAITDRLNQQIPLRRELHGTPSGTAKLSADTATANREEDARQFDNKLAAFQSNLNDSNLQEAEQYHYKVMLLKAKRAEEVKARDTPGTLWGRNVNNKVNGKDQPGYTQGLAAEQALLDAMEKSALQRIEQLKAGAVKPR